MKTRLVLIPLFYHFVIRAREPHTFINLQKKITYGFFIVFKTSVTNRLKRNFNRRVCEITPLKLKSKTDDTLILIPSPLPRYQQNQISSTL